MFYLRPSLKSLVCASVFVALLLFHASAQAQNNSSAEASKALHALFAAEWDYQMEQYPTWASTLGDRRWNDRWSDDSLEAITKRHDHDRQVLTKLAQIDRGMLSATDRLNYDLFKKEYADRVEGFQYRRDMLPLNQLEGVQAVNQLADMLRFSTVKDYEDWLARLKGLSVRIEQTVALMRQGVKEGIVYPKVVLQRVPAQIDHQIVSDPKASPLYKPFTRFPESVTESDRTRLAQAAQQIIAAQVVPAYRQLKEFFVKDYLPAALDHVGVWQLPNGAAMYAQAVRDHTTTNLSPKEIHELGLSEVRRIRGEMQRLIDKVGFKGSFAEFVEYLRRDRRFYFQSEAELLDAYRAMSRRIDPALVKVFRTLPRMPYGIEPIPANIAPDSPAAYYRGPAADGSRAGTFLPNTYKPEIRPKYEMMALTLHEAVPGHHCKLRWRWSKKSCPTFAATAATLRSSRAGGFTPNRSATKWDSTTIRMRSSDSSSMKSGAPAG